MEMQYCVAASAQPTDHEWLGVIIMMGFKSMKAGARLTTIWLHQHPSL